MIALQRWVGAGLDLLFPIQCTGCGEAGAIWCDECDVSIIRLTEPQCQQCGCPLENRRSCPSCASRRPTLQVRSYARYKEPVARALLHLKYRPDRRLASVMGAWLEELRVRDGWRASIIIPVPLSKRRMQKRGFNQAALLAEALGRRAVLPVDPSHLKRVVDTRSQVGLDPYERWHNVRQAFKAESRSFEGEHVLIVDDLFTTGATLSACATVIRAAGAQSVVGLTVARA
ncbi:MAG: ComF family protein [Anaerolineae bacterium]|nr:MAG: ComF family protein [Anaerolineae bacterium]